MAPSFAEFNEEAEERDSGSALVEQPDPIDLDAEGMTGKVAMVTGGASGLGQAIALSFARRGVHVAFNYVEMAGRDIGELAVLTEASLRSTGIKVFCDEADVRDPEQVEGFITAAEAELGGLHYLINNAGIAADGALWRLSDQAWKSVMDTNVTGAFNCIREATSRFRAQRYGKIVNVASHQVTHPGFGVSNYAASKAALVGLTKSAAVELGAANVNVNAVAPGFVRTERLGQLPEHVIREAEKASVLGRLADPEDVAQVVTFLCSREARHITGQVIVVDGGMTLT